MRHKYYNQSGNVMKCNGQYVTNDPCFPVCSLPDGSGCDWAGIYGGGIGGPAEQHTITTGNAVTGNTSTRTVTPMIDPYQSIVPSQLSYDGSNREELTDMDGSPSELWFNAEGGCGYGGVMCEGGRCPLDGEEMAGGYVRKCHCEIIGNNDFSCCRCSRVKPDWGRYEDYQSEMMYSNDYFNQSGDNVIEVGGHKYAFEPVLSWRPNCDTMDDSGDGIFTNQNCSQGPGIGGVSGLGVSALRFKDGKMY